jgi:S-adenosylmethionine synthetase
MNDAPFEVVERKGRGHPDTICDLLAEQVSVDLAQHYLKTCGRILHYNVDKALLAGGVSVPRFGGGKIVEPAKFYLGGQAAGALDGQRLDLDGVIEKSITSWLAGNLRFLRLGDNLVWKNEIKQGAAALNGVEDRAVSNDTSVGVGYWPPSDLEAMTLALEEYMNASVFKNLHPETGEDIKVMAVRQGKNVNITLACALVDRFIDRVGDYEAKKAAIQIEAMAFLKETYRHHDFSLVLNALDDPSRGQDGLFLTVTGLSSEGGDSGQVGRGNRVNGLISFLRPQTMEAWAGKNSRTHVGRIYSFAAQALARILTEEMGEISEATILLVGKIGAPVDRPPYVFADLKTWGHHDIGVREKTARILKTAIEHGDVFQPGAFDTAGRTYGSDASGRADDATSRS